MTTPGASSAEILGAWTGESEHGDLVRLARQRSDIAPEGLVNEFVEGVGRFLTQQRRSARQQALADLRAAPTAENLRRHQQLSQGLGQGLGQESDQDLGEEKQEDR